jgi:hypothetical protein
MNYHGIELRVKIPMKFDMHGAIWIRINLKYLTELLWQYQDFFNEGYKDILTDWLTET